MQRKIRHQSKNRVVVVADDMGKSSSVNSAIAEAHKRGILTSASIMAGGQAFEEAVIIAAECSSLSVGLHVTLCDGRAVLPPSQIPDLVDRDGNFEESPAKTWINCTSPGVFSQIEAEVQAQFSKLSRAGICPTHVDGHHHLQMHPRIFEIVCKQASQRGVGWIRLPSEPLALVLGFRSFARGFMPFIEWVVFRMLSAYNLKTAWRYGINVAYRCFGLSWTGSIDEKCFIDLLDYAKGPIDEIFVHPDNSTDSGRRELEALTSTDVRNKVYSCTDLVGYRELSGEGIVFGSVLGGVSKTEHFVPMEKGDKKVFR